MNLAVWTEDEAGPFQTIPMPGQSWHEGGSGECREHQYVRNGTAKLLTLFCPSSGEVRAKGITGCPNTVLHPWLRSELGEVLAGLPPAVVLEPDINRQQWYSWQEGHRLRWFNKSGEQTVFGRILKICGKNMMTSLSGILSGKFLTGNRCGLLPKN